MSAALVGTFALLVACALAADFYSGTKVKVLTEASFNDLVSGGNNGGWLVEFYAPWCSHCVKFKPTWIAVAAADPPIAAICAVDITVEKSFKARFDIKGFPTILFFLDGLVYPFAGNRDIEGFRAFVTDGYKKIKPTEYKLSAAVAGSKSTPPPALSDASSDSAHANRITSPSQFIATHPVAAFFGTCILVALIVGLVASRRRRKSGARALIHDLESVTLSETHCVSTNGAASKLN